MELAAAITVLAFPISLGGLIRLKLCQFLLHAPLHLLAFVQRPKSARRAPSADRSILAISQRRGTRSIPTSSTETIIFNCDVNEYPFQKSTRLPEDSYPRVFPVPSLSSHLRTLLISTQN